MLLAIWDHDVGAAPERHDVLWVLAFAGWAAWISLQILRGADGRKASSVIVAFFQGPEHCNERERWMVVGIVMTIAALPFLMGGCQVRHR